MHSQKSLTFVNKTRVVAHRDRNEKGYVMNKIACVILTLVLIFSGCSKKRETGFNRAHGNMVNPDRNSVSPAVVKVEGALGSGANSDKKDDWKDLENAPTMLDVRNLAKCLGRTRDTMIGFMVPNNGRYVFETGDDGTILLKFLHYHANRNPGPHLVWELVSYIEVDATTGKVVRWGAWGEHRMAAYSVEEFDDLQSQALAMCD